MSVLFFRQKLDAYCRRHVERTARWLVLLSRLEGFPVVAETSPARWTLHGTIVEDVFAACYVVPDNVRFAAGLFHLIQRPQLLRVSFELCLYFSPRQIFMTVPVALEPGLQ